MSRGLTDPIEEPDDSELPASNEDIMAVVLSVFMMVESLHQRLDLANFPKIPMMPSGEFTDGE